MYRRMLDGSYGNVMPYRWPIDCHVALGEPAEAAQCAEDGLAIRDDEFDLLVVAGQHWEQLGNNDRALVYVERASRAQSILMPAMPKWALFVMDMAGKMSNIDVTAVARYSVEKLNAEERARKDWVDRMLSFGKQA